MEMLEDRVVLTQLVNGLFDTGVDSSGNALAAGATDSHYTLTSAPSGVSTGPVVVASTLGSGWLGDNATDQWISPTADQGDDASEPNGTYTYTTTFNATTVNGTAQLSGSILGAQNLVSASINGYSTAFTSTSNNYSAYVPFSLFGHVVQGTNTLSFTVSNTSSSSEGIHVQGLALDNLPTVAADNAQVYITAGQTATDTGTFSDPDSGDTVTITASRGTVTQSGTNSGTWSISEATVTNGGPVVVTATDNHGGVSSTSYTINIGAAPPPTLTSGGVAGNATAGGSAVYADPNIVLTDYGPNLTTASISIGTNFSAANDRLLFTAQNGITGSYSTSTGILTLSGSATPAQYQTALRSIQYQDINPSETDDQPRTINFSIAAGTYNATNGHFYQFVRDPGITWLNAKAAADASTLYGLKGYLATLTSMAENVFAFSKTESTGWIGASDAGNVGHWEWADGPENGLQFWQGLGNGVPVNGQYNDWNAGEPNDSGGVEFYAQYLSNGLWNDLANTATVNGYLVEYGGSTGDPSLQLTSANTVNVSSQTPAPTVTSPTGPETVSSPTLSVQGTAPAGSLVQVYSDLNADGQVDGADAVVGTEQLAAGVTTYAINVTLPANGVSNFLVTATNSGATASLPTVVPAVTYYAPPTLTAGGGLPSTVLAGSAPAVVDPGLVLGDAGPNLLGASVSIGANFTASDDRLLFTNQNGITGSYNTSTGILTLSGSATASQYQAALRSVEFQDINPYSANDAARTITFSVGSGDYDEYNGHFYLYVLDPNITWDAANAAANASSLYGIQGYLATITSAAEDAFAFSKVQANGWIGGNSVANNSIYEWVDGPEAGTPFWSGFVNGSPVNGAYTNWDANQPDDANGVEHYVQFDDRGKWNDLPDSDPYGPPYGPIQGYLVEYGGSAGDPTLQLTSNATINVYSITDTPVVTGPVAYVNAPNYTITGSADPGSLVTIYDDINNNGAVDLGEPVAGTEQLAAGQTSYSIPVALVQNAANHFLVNAIDLPANVSLFAPVTITSINTPPPRPTVLTPLVPFAVNASTVTITGVAQANSLVQIYADTNDNGSLDSGETLIGSEQLTGGATSFSIPTNLAQNAVNHFIVTATDQAGNQSMATAVPTVTEISIPPIKPTVLTPSNAISVNTPTDTIIGLAAAGTLVQIFKNGSVVGSEQLAAGQTSFAIAVPLATNQQNSFTATDTDAAGNQSTPTTIPTITENSIPPLGPVVITPAASVSINAGSYTITGTAQAGSLVQVFKDFNGNGSIDVGDFVVGSIQLGAGATSFSITVPLTQNSANTFLVTATDSATNQSVPALVPTITADSIAPYGPTVLTPTGTTLVNTPTATVTGSSEAGSLVQIYEDFNNNGGIDVGDILVGFELLAPGQTAYSIPATLVANGVSHLLVTATDAAGNTSSPVRVPTINNDEIAPVVPIVTSPILPLSINAGSVPITGTAEANSFVQVFDDVDGVTTLVGSEQLTGGSTSFSIAAPLAPNTANEFTVTATDAATNQSIPAIVPPIIEDSIPPLAPVVTSPIVSYSVNALTATLTGIAEAGSLVNLYSGDMLVGTEQLDPDQTTYSIAVPLAQNAANNFTVTSTDAAGNVSPPTVAPTIVEDSIPPVTPTDVSPITPVSINALTATLVGIAEAGSLVDIYDGDDNLVGTEQLVAGQTTYSIVVPIVQNAANDFTVTSADAAGNVSTPLVMPTITEDSIPPLAPIVLTPSAAVPLNTPTATITGTAEAGSLVSVYDGDDNLVGTEQLDPDQTIYSIAVPLVANADNDFTVTSTDAAGNQSDPATVPTITSDTIPPLTPVGISPTIPTFLNAPTDTLTGTAEAGSLINVYSGDTLVGTEQLGPDQTTYSITVPLTQNDPNNFTVTSTDAAGNVSPSLTVPTVTEISIPPLAPIGGSPTHPTSVNATSTTLTGTAEAGSLIDVYDGNGNLVGMEQLAPGQTSYSITVPLAQNEPNNFTVTSTDAAGNVSPTLNVPTITEISIPPLAPVEKTPSAPTSVNATTTTLTGTAPAGSLVQIYGDTNGDGVVDGQEHVVGYEQLAPGQTSYSITVPLTPNSANHFLAVTTDAAGNASSTVDVPTVTEDSIAPAAPVVSHPTGLSFVNAPSEAITGTAEAGSLVKVYAGGTVVGSEQLAPGQTSYSLTVPLAQNKLNTFTVTATDAAGNASIPTIVPSVTEISTLPLSPTIGSPSGPISVNATTTTLTGTAPAGSLVQIYGDTNGDGVVDGQEHVVGFEQLAPGQTSYSITVPLTPNSANHFLAVTTDAAGNASKPVVVPTITEISTAPLSPTVGSPSAPTSVNATTATLTGTAPAGSLVTVYADINGVETPVGTEQLAPGQTSYSITVPLVANSANNFLVTSTDAAGNVSTTTTVPTITEISTAPASPTTGVPSAGSSVNSGTYTLTGTAPAGSLVKVYADINGVETVVGSLQLAPGQTSYSITVPLVADTVNNFLVTTTDAAGNVSAPLVVPPIREADLTGTVFHDLNSDGSYQSGEPGLAGRVVFLDLNHDGTLDPGDPTATTDANGNFSFPSYAQGAAPVLEAPSQDATGQYVVDQYSTNADGSVSIAVTPISPIAPVPVVPTPFTATPATDANYAYVESLYAAVLGRTGSTSEVSGWLNEIGAGMTHTQIAADFVNSVEHRTDQVDAFYQEYLHRAPDPGSTVWVNELLAGASEEQVSESILESPEYLSAHQDPTLFVRDLYIDVLGRTGEDTGVAAWTGQLASGMTQDQIIARFVEGDEASGQVVDSLYSAYLHRQPEAVTSDPMLTMLQGPGGSATLVATDMLASPEFAQDSEGTATTTTTPGSSN